MKPTHVSIFVLVFILSFRHSQYYRICVSKKNNGVDQKFDHVKMHPDESPIMKRSYFGNELVLCRNIKMHIHSITLLFSVLNLSNFSGTSCSIFWNKVVSGYKCPGLSPDNLQSALTALDLHETEICDLRNSEKGQDAYSHLLSIYQICEKPKD